MRLFKWSKMHEAFIPEIDAEHRTMFRLGQELQEAVVGGSQSERLRPLLDSLLSAMEGHFSHEERMMHAASYPAYLWHKEQHDAVRKRLRQFSDAVGRGEQEAPEMLLEYFRDWLQGHTRLSDRMMAAYLRNRRRVQAAAS